MKDTTLSPHTKLLLLPLTLFCFGVILCLPNAARADGYVCSHGYSTFGDKVLNGGVGDYGSDNRYYWVSSSFSDTYVGYISTAVEKWVYTTESVGVTTPISLLKTTTQSSSSFDFYKKSLGEGLLGETRFFSLQRRDCAQQQRCVTQELWLHQDLHRHIKLQ